MGLEIVIGVSGDIRGHTGTRLSAHGIPQAQGKRSVSGIAQCLGKGGGVTQHEVTMSHGLWVNIATALLSQTVNGLSIPRNQLI